MERWKTEKRRVEETKRKSQKKEDTDAGKFRTMLFQWFVGQEPRKVCSLKAAPRCVAKRISKAKRSNTEGFGLKSNESLFLKTSIIQASYIINRCERVQSVQEPYIMAPCAFSTPRHRSPWAAQSFNSPSAAGSLASSFPTAGLELTSSADIWLGLLVILFVCLPDRFITTTGGGRLRLQGDEKLTNAASHQRPTR